jgi:hypothetical protein
MSLVFVLAAALQEVEVRTTATYTGFSGSMTFDERGTLGNGVEFSPPAGIVPGIEFVYWDRPHRMFLDVRRLALSGRETLDEERQWNETLFAAGETVDMRFNWDRVRLGIEIATKIDESAYLTGIGALRYDIMRFMLDSAAHDKDDDTIGVLSVEGGVGFRGTISRDWLIEMDVRLIYTDLLADDSAGAAGGLRIRWRPDPRVEISVGFELEGLSVLKDERTERNHLNYVAGGPSLGLAIKF